MTALYRTVVLMLALAGCSADTFTRALDDAGSNAQTQSDSAIEIDSAAADGGSDSDTIVDGMTADVSADVKPDVCTSFQKTWVCENASIQAPSQYCQNTMPAGIGMTPVVCRCTETYTCACLKSQSFGCSIGDTWKCTDSNGRLQAWCEPQ